MMKQRLSEDIIRPPIGICPVFIGQNGARSGDINPIKCGIRGRRLAGGDSLRYNGHIHEELRMPTPSTSPIQPPAHFVWIDCEMTGLNPEMDTILEIATIIT